MGLGIGEVAAKAVVVEITLLGKVLVVIIIAVVVVVKVVVVVVAIGWLLGSGG